MIFYRTVIGDFNWFQGPNKTIQRQCTHTDYTDNDSVRFIGTYWNNGLLELHGIERNLRNSRLSRRSRGWWLIYCVAISGTMCMWRRDRKILRSRCQVIVCNMQLCSTPPSPVYLLVPWSLRVYSAVEPHTSATWCTETCTGCFSNRFLDGTTCISAASQVWQWGVLSWKVDFQPQNMKGIRLSI